MTSLNLNNLTLDEFLNYVETNKDWRRSPVLSYIVNFFNTKYKEELNETELEIDGDAFESAIALIERKLKYEDEVHLEQIKTCMKEGKKLLIEGHTEENKTKLFSVVDPLTRILLEVIEKYETIVQERAQLKEVAAKEISVKCHVCDASFSIEGVKNEPTASN